MIDKSYNALRLFLFSVLSLAILAGCSDDDDNNGSSEPGNIIEVAEASGSFTTLLAALEATGLDDVLADESGTYTVFAPTDAAFAALPEGTVEALLDDPETLTDILLYHVISGAAVDSATAISLDGSSAEMANGDDVDISVVDGTLFLNDSAVTNADVAASNGLIHVIDSVLIPPAEPFAELYEQGVDQYLGLYTPMMSEPNGDLVQHTFGVGDGPLCLLGGEYTMATREGAGDTVMIFLEGGGACNSQLCQATPTASPGMPTFGIMNPADPLNPAADYDVAYLPYCDGSIFGGDIDIDDDGDGMVDRYHRGVKNLSGAIDVIAATFPNPQKILLTGNSAGGYGTDFALPLVRKTFPDAQIELINDSGVGIAFPGYVDFVTNEWNSGAFFPASCTDCITEDGHTTGYHIYQLDQDPDLRAGFMSTKQDAVIADVFLGIGGEAFEAALLPEMAAIEAAHPERFRSLIANGSSHTFLQAQFTREVGDTNVRDWVGDMLMESDDWVTVIDEDAPASGGTIIDVAEANGSFTILLAAVEAAGLTGVLSDETGTFTVFAPTDAAFAALPEGTVDALLADIPALTNVLTYHVIAGVEVGSADAVGLIGSDVEMFNGATVSVSAQDGALFLNDSQVIIPDVPASNGVIHVIDAVLIPPTE